MRFAKEIFPECFRFLNPETVLDLGCGDGRISLKFAERGKKVLGVDKRLMSINHKNFTFFHQDVRDFIFKEKYGLIFSSMILHFLKDGEAVKIIENMKKNTLEGGYNFLICMSKEDFCARKNPRDFYVDEIELEGLYSGWEIIKNELCFSKPHQHGNAKMHKHKIIVFLARKI